MFILILHLLFIFGTCSSQLLDVPVFINESTLIPRVVNGYTAALGDVPYQVGFKTMRNRRRHMFYTFCGGVIIRNTKVLSAAHCFKTSKSGCCSESIVLGGRDVARYFAVAATLRNREVYRPYGAQSTSAQWRRLARVIFPSSYKFPKDDIAVVMTRRPFMFNSYVAPIPYSRHHTDYRGECLVSGYGRINRHAQSEVLLHAYLELLPSYYCNQIHRRNMRRFICTSGEVSDVGKGDSGGPLVCKRTGEPQESALGIVVGIVSGKRYLRGHGRGAGSFYTRVSSYSTYIAKNVARSREMMYFYIYFCNVLFYFFRYIRC